ncbi:MAG TPA: AMP-binding protein [Acidimicrobiales bacterium]|nr:AMP-binding protein [Acidimicrobiales bacterium]
MGAGPTSPVASDRTSTAAYRAARDDLLALRDQYERAMTEFSFPDVGPIFNWAHDWFDPVARGNPSPALVVVEEDGTRRSWSFDHLASRSDQVASWLHDTGVRAGDPLVVMLGNQVALWETMLGAMKLGAVIVPTTTALGPSDLSDRLTRSAARFVVCNPVDAPKFDAVPGGYGRISVGNVPGWHDLEESYTLDAAPVAHPHSAADDPLLLYFTSGTTSRPKLVEHTQISYPVGHLSTMYWIGIRPGDVHCNISSPGWAKHAWSCFFAPWAAEATVLVLDYARFDPDTLLVRLREERATTFCAPPTVWRMLITSDLSGGPGTLRELVAAGEPLNPEVITQVRQKWGLTIRDGYGQTETTASVGNPPGAPVKAGSMGRPLPGVPAVLVDVATGNLVEGPGEGELCLDLDARPCTLMAGYRSGAEDAMAGGYYHSGDVATRDDDGYITFVGRTDDVFKSSDYKVSPFEVESVLIEHPAVAEAAVVPAPDELRLCVPKAYIALSPGSEASRETALELLRFARARLAPYQRVRRVEFCELPKTISGKIRRVELRAREEAHPPRDAEWREEDFPELRA